MRNNVCMPTRGVWGHAPPVKFILSSQIASDAIRDKISKQHFDDTSVIKKKKKRPGGLAIFK